MSAPVTVKLCGLTTRLAVEAAARGGADLLGFIFAPKSVRRVTPEQARILAADRPGAAQTVAVTAGAGDDELTTIVERFAPDLIQLHGGESPQRVAEVKERFGLPVIVALPVAAAADVDRAKDYPMADHLLFDTKPAPGEAEGGTGRSFNWSLVAGRDFGVPWLLAGGLSPDTVAEALAQSGAPGVDASSALETRPGLKSPERIAAFLRAARAPSTSSAHVSL